MACSIGYHLCNANEPDRFVASKVALVADILLYPFMAVICAVVFAVLMVVKLLFLAIKFLVNTCIAACKSRPLPSCKENFQCLFGPKDKPGPSDWLGCLVLIPIIGTLIYSTIITVQSDTNRLRYFIISPAYQVGSTAIINW
ncbi:hypothetical protein CpB0249 [Chlamydia pneumoniae TW-183]|uniref:Uncharacterized protein n=3 Tax=Chlamydia pneumoniae TaxID=83558 RepID=Q9Z8U1_CHLPN|nr:hypothetical protein CPn_0243 [Chlamydia pneumoniae CWL029]AAF38345.1 hypothetical protein CP_0519 [Chlamydia pneumoniae AR39]AAP98182.1 hypothetical protein CpB0249 [Chlamydia pneumoniae TW-183]CRI32743.1 Uncharacterized protein BN1224_Wien1_A_02500 [Chlamydia pneumoniae]BAA98453.1 hypothetical protein [Chlamydia pneumoniae J138]